MLIQLLKKIRLSWFFFGFFITYLLLEDYIQACLRQRKIAEGGEQYEALISHSLNYDGEDKETMEKLLNNLVANQTNRSNLAMQLGNNFAMHAIKALLCTGLSMLMINLLKLSTLTHKAKNIWDPMQKLLRTRFYRID